MTIPAPRRRPRSEALARVAHERQRLADAGLALLYAAIFLGYTGIYLGEKALYLPWVGGSGPGILGIQPTIELFSRAAIGFVMVCAVALAWRRSRPEMAFLVIWGVGCIQVAVGEPIRFWNIAMPIALFSAAAYASRSFARLALVIALLGYVGIWAIEVRLLERLDSLPNPFDVLGTPRGATFVVVFALLGLIWAVGDQFRAARERLERDLERTEQLAREQEANARIGALAERHRVARDLHDVVAHGFSVMIVQADGAQYAEAEHPEAPRQALATIASTGRESLYEMRRLLGVLRDDPSAAERAPQPDLASLPTLIDRFRESGLDVTYTEEGTIRPMPPAVGLTAYRAVQESLTNVLDHAGPARVDVRMAFSPEVLEVVVANEPGSTPPRPAAAFAGLGLLGMRERVSLLDGRMTAGPTPSGGFRVQVEIPIEWARVDPARRRGPDERGPQPTSGPDVSEGSA
ncbi:MAG: sensor histidine kinase [Candidatus Limnocylindrales bacterium]